jgi:superfamily II DNA/RNA helicase
MDTRHTLLLLLPVEVVEPNARDVRLLAQLRCVVCTSPNRLCVSHATALLSFLPLLQVEVVEPNARDERLLSLLQQHHKSRKNRIIIFVLYKKEAPRVEALLKRRGWTAAAIHGDISQAQRTAAVEAFKAGTCPLLIATGGFRGATELRVRGRLLLGYRCQGLGVW